MLDPVDFQDQAVNEQWVYVKYKSNLKESPQAQPLSGSSKSSAISNIMKVRVPDGMDPITYCNKLRNSSPDLLYADPIVEYVQLGTPSDALIANQFYLENIRVFDAWDITQGDDDITIAIIDSGIDLDHEDITNNLWINTDDPVDGVDNDNNGFVDDYYGYDFADGDTDPSIQNGNHGMIVAGIAGASTNNAVGIAGVGYNTKVAALKGFRSSDGKSGGLYDAIVYAAENGFDVANLSWGRMGQPLQSEQDIIDYAVLDLDMVLVAAAGNEGGKSTQENKWYPASYDHVLSVGASDANDNKSSGSTFNTKVDLLAPGVSMYSTINGNGYTNGGPGTSYAAPQVAATAALVKDQFPALSAVQIMERVRVTTDDIYDVGSNATYDGKLGKGRLNVLRAVSESSPRSLRAENPTLTSVFGGDVFFGDTVNVTATLTNHLSPINSPLVSITSPNNDFIISTGNFQPGYMSSLDTREISFEIVLDENTLPETDIEIRLDFSATGYNDFQFLEVTTSPDYTDFGNENLSLTVSGDGNLAFDSYDPLAGSGFNYQLDTLMTYAGILLATNSSEVSDNIIANYSSNARNQDFTVNQFYKRYHHPAADFFGYSEFNDIKRTVLIEQSNIAWDGTDYLIMRYRLVNTSSSAINNLTFGVFADWDLDDELANYAEYDVVDDYIFARDGSNSLFAGIKIMGGDNIEYSALDMAALNGNTQEINSAFSDADKYDYLVNQNLTNAGGSGAGNDVATLNGVTINQLNAYDESYVDVFYAISDSQANLEALFTNAQNQLDAYLLKPRLLETFSVCSGTSLTIDPAEGTLYDFYEDPLAQDYITTATSINAGVITKDTSFYVKNMDNSYPSDVFELRVVQFNDIADFGMSTDTLYLDNPTTNVVHFTDLSLDATSWNWDFDQGTLATIQNPSLSFSTPGSYSISLQVANDLGCMDSITKDLVVANRPSTPTLSDHVICPGETVVITEPGAEKIHVYAFENSESPTLSGTSINIEEINHDTTVYVSGVYGSFESNKVAVNIDVLEVLGSIAFSPDTTSANHQIILAAQNLEAGASVTWTINGSPAGSTTEVTTPAVAGTIDVSLEITSADACTVVLSREIQISTSPFASQQDLVSCSGEEVNIQPENGLYFGFYEDPALTQLIKKGKQLQTNTHAQVYVVNLDDGLPGMPIEVNIANQTLEFEISYTTVDVGTKHKVEFAVETTESLADYAWYINGVLSETSASPIFFFDDELYEIVLESSGATGCQNADTLLLDFTPPLTLTDPLQFNVYPNPTDGFVSIHAVELVDEISIFGLDGKQVFKAQTPGDSMDLTSLGAGLYVIRAKMESATLEQYLLIR